MRVKYELDQDISGPLKYSPRSSHLTTCTWETKGVGKIIKKEICEVSVHFLFAMYNS